MAGANDQLTNSHNPPGVEWSIENADGAAGQVRVGGRGAAAEFLEGVRIFFNLIPASQILHKVPGTRVPKKTLRVSGFVGWVGGGVNKKVLNNYSLRVEVTDNL